MAELSTGGKGKKEGGEGEEGNSGADTGEEGGDGDNVKSKEESVKVEYLPLDLSSFQSTTDFVRGFKEKNLPLHILINNAALCALPYSKYPALSFCSVYKSGSKQTYTVSTLAWCIV